MVKYAASMAADKHALNQVIVVIFLLLVDLSTVLAKLFNTYY